VAAMKHLLTALLALVVAAGCGKKALEADAMADRFDDRGMLDSGLKEKLDRLDNEPPSNKGTWPWQRGWPWWKWIIFVIGMWSTINLVLNFDRTFKRPESFYQNIPPGVFRFTVATPTAERLSLIILIIAVVGILRWIW